MTQPTPEIGKDWKAKTLRATVFFRLGWDVAVPTSRAFWKAACADEPEVSERGLARAQDVGRWNNGKLVVKVEPAGGDSFRLDLIWESAWYRIDGVEAIREFAGLVGRMLSAPQLPAASRVAFAATAGWPTPERGIAYKQLAALVPRMRIDDGMREVIIRYNRLGPARDTGHALPKELPINRVGTWACQQLLPLLALDPALAQGQMHNEFAAVCEVDMSTVADYDGGWTAEQSLAWIGCLILEGVQIIEKGDAS
jgi:hypothetical protein